MSASREKKQRQSAGPDQKALKAQQEQAARRRTTIIYSVIAAVIAVLVAALLIWRSGFFQARASAVTLGDETLSTAELSFYYYNARQTTATYASWGLSSYDSSKSDDEQYYSEADNQTYRDYFLESALTNAQQDKALADEAVKAGHTESEVKESVDTYISSVKTQASSSGYGYAAYLRAVYGPYMNSGTLEKLYTRYQMANLARSDKYTELYDGYTQSDLDAYYEEHKDDLDTIEYSSLYFPIAAVDTKDADGNELDEDEVSKLEEEAKSDAKDKAEAALSAVEGGSSFQSQIDQYELTGTSNTDHATVVGTSSISTSYSEQLLKLDEDECGLVETDSGYYVVSLHSRYLNDASTLDVRHILARAETTADGSSIAAPTDEAWAAAKAKMDEIQAAWDAGDKSEDAFAKLANENSDDGDGTTGGLYERVYDGAFVPELNDWLFGQSHQHGDVSMIQHNGDAESTSSGEYWGYHLIFYVGENEPVWMGTARSALATQDRTTWIEELSANYPTVLTDGANYLGR